MDGADDSPAAARWRRLSTDRREEVRRLSPGREVVDAKFFDRRAKRFEQGMMRAKVADDPLTRRLRRVTGESTTLLDVGAGTGRFAIALAPGVRHVTAVEPSERMLEIARNAAEAAGITNLTTIQSTWEEAITEPADVVFSAHVLTLVPDAVPFVRKLHAAARERVVLYLGAYSVDAVLDPLWRHFHGAPRVPGPSYLDAVAVLRELGIAPEVRPVEIDNHRRFATIDEAVDIYRDALLLPDEPAVRDELGGLMRGWLMGRRGAYRSPLRTVPAAIIEWRPGRETRTGPAKAPSS